MEMDAKAERLWNLMIDGDWILPSRCYAVKSQAESNSLAVGSDKIITGPLLDAINEEIKREANARTAIAKATK